MYRNCINSMFSPSSQLLLFHSQVATYNLHSQVATYTEGSSKLEWREVGNLPSARYGLRAALVDNVIHVTGGFDDDYFLASILAWDSSSESWQDVGDLAVARSQHAAVGVSSSVIEC